MFLCSSKINCLLNFEEVCSLKCIDCKSFKNETSYWAKLKTITYFQIGYLEVIMMLTGWK